MVLLEEGVIFQLTNATLYHSFTQIVPSMYHIVTRKLRVSFCATAGIVHCLVHLGPDE